jgi:hypothetical protein
MLAGSDLADFPTGGAVDTFNAVIGLVTALVGLVASVLTIRGVRRSHLPAKAPATGSRPADAAAPAPREPASLASNVELGLLHRIAADEARAAAAVVTGSLVTAGVILAARALEDIVGIALALLMVIAALGVGRLVYRWQYAYNRLVREAEWRAGRYDGTGAPATALLSAELTADAASTTFSLVAGVVPSLLLGGALSGVLLAVGDIGPPGVVLLLIAPYVAIAGLIWPWRKRRVLPSHLARVIAS